MFIDPIGFEEVDKMSFRKIFCLMAALVMTFGANDLFAQEALPRGTRVRLVSPDSAAWAGIG